MPTQPIPPTEKPVSQVWRPELTRLPRLSWTRRLFRRFIKALCRLLVLTCTRCEARGLENYPSEGAALVVINHLADADAVVALAALPDFPEVIGKIELRDILPLRWVTDPLGIIWVHRGRPDRRALSVALEALRQGRRVIVAPEGRESLTGALEQGTEGTTFLAFKSGAPIIPIALTGTERVYGSLKRLQRARVTLSVGKPFILARQDRGPDALAEGTRQIMETLARLLPVEYRGEYAYVGEVHQAEKYR
ncbi:MAG: 1-acyl-sn-glycerol-3-phosphate acyltransferase [Chloroflexi bacterium]|nr:1-acyl-sn-glycerol-3-phosphate acyltransferase [Chloroflexota bacterium]